MPIHSNNTIKTAAKLTLFLLTTIKNAKKEAFRPLFLTICSILGVKKRKKESFERIFSVMLRGE